MFENVSTPHLHSRHMSEGDDEMAASVARLFQLVAQGNLDHVQLMLAPKEIGQEEDKLLNKEVCHPLCSCERCSERERLIGTAQKKQLTGVAARTQAFLFSKPITARHWICTV